MTQFILDLVPEDLERFKPGRMSREKKLIPEHGRKLYFISLHSLKRDVNASNGFGYKKIRASMNYLNKLKCQHCGRVFHKEFGLKSHKKYFHGEEIRSKFEKVTLRNQQYLKDVRGDIDDDFDKSDVDIISIHESDDDMQEIQVSDNYLKPKEKSTHVTISYDHKSAKDLSKLDIFSPVIKLRDLYKFKEQKSSFDLPNKEEAKRNYESKVLFNNSSQDEGDLLVLDDSDDPDIDSFESVETHEVDPLSIDVIEASFTSCCGPLSAGSIKYLHKRKMKEFSTENISKKLKIPAGKPLFNTDGSDIEEITLDDEGGEQICSRQKPSQCQAAIVIDYELPDQIIDDSSDSGVNISCEDINANLSLENERDKAQESLQTIKVIERKQQQKYSRNVFFTPRADKYDADLNRNKLTSTPIIGNSFLESGKMSGTDQSDDEIEVISEDDVDHKWTKISDEQLLSKIDENLDILTKEAKKLQGIRIERLANLGFNAGSGINVGKLEALSSSKQQSQTEVAKAGQSGSKSKPFLKEQNYVDKNNLAFEINEVVCIE